MQTLKLENFASFWGDLTNQIPDEFKHYWFACDTRHKAADKEDLEYYLERFLHHVTKSSAKRENEENKKIFERGWSEHKKLFEAKPTLDALKPKYYDNLPSYGSIGGQQLYRFRNRSFLPDMQILYMRYLVLTLFAPYKSIHEFGSGTGMNIMAMAECAPQKKFIGYEWTSSGVDLLRLIGEKMSFNVAGRSFDMFNPDGDVNIEGEAALTVCSVEQLGENDNDFIDFLIAKKPGLVVNIEPCTMFDEGLYNRLAVLYMMMRGYPQNFSQKLLDMEQRGYIEILFKRHIPWIGVFGRYACTVWRPK